MSVGSHALRAGHGRLLRAWLAVAAALVAAVLALTLWATHGSSGNTESPKAPNAPAVTSDGLGVPIARPLPPVPVDAGG